MLKILWIKQDKKTQQGNTNDKCKRRLGTNSVESKAKIIYRNDGKCWVSMVGI